LKNYPEADKKVTGIASELWGDSSEKIRSIGKGKVFADGQTIEEVFENLNIQPDLLIPDNKDALFIHRTLPDGDIYFISNQKNQSITIHPQFGIAGKAPELWNPLTNEIRDLKEFSVSGKITTVPLTLDAYESSFIVFRKKGKSASSAKNFLEKEVLTGISTPWQVSFEPGKRGPEETITLNALEDWSTSQDERIRYFSGKAIYKNKFTVTTIPAKQIYIDLGKVMVMAKIKINGQDAGGVWTNPYKVNITKWLKQGENTVEIEVVNNWMNRLIGDQQLPEKDRQTWVNVNPWNANSKLQSSGLLGPVEIQVY
jgi:hypothetical protein